jgi:anti-sigma factor RsiW
MNSDVAYAGLGPCEEFECELAELIDATLDAGRASAVQRHLDGCARCRAFVRDMRALDASLAHALPQVQLSADFDARLRERIARLPRTLANDAARAAAEDEYRSIVRALRRGVTWRTTLNALGAAAIGGAFAFALGSTTPLLAHTVAAFEPMIGTVGLYVAGLAVACGLAAPSVLRRSGAFG